MLHQSNRKFLPGLALLAAGLLSCNPKSNSATETPVMTTPAVATSGTAAATPQGQCYVHLFDDDKFQDDNVIVKGPAAFANLKKLPNTTKDWDDEADSMKVGPGTTVVVWNKENYQGDSTVFQAGAQIPKLHVEMRSMKIRCK